MRTLAAGGLYYLLAFGAGFVLGVVRVLWLAPRVGERSAELIEAPLMLMLLVPTSRFVVRTMRVPPAIVPRLGLGLTALCLLLLTEFSVVLWLRELSIEAWLAARDPIAGAVYVLMLVIFAALPALVHRR